MRAGQADPYLWICLPCRDWWIFLFGNGNLSLLFADVPVKSWKGDKKDYADQVFNTLDVGVEVNECVQRFNHATGNHILTCQLA